MSTQVIEDHHTTTFHRCLCAFDVIKALQRRKPPSQSNRPRVSAEDETACLTKIVVIMTIIAVTPLAALHIALYFYPELFMIPITPH